MKVLSVRQPWAWLLIHSTKNIENRKWATGYRGLLGIHAASGMSREDWTSARLFVASFDRQLSECIPMPSELIRGAVIGTMMLRNCFRHYESPWFEGPVGWLLENPESFDPIHVKGMLGLWDWDEKPCKCCRWEKTP